MDSKATSVTRWVVILTGIGSLMAALDTLVVSTALSKIRLSLGASIEQLEWTVNAYNLSFAVLLITAAALGDRFGRRRLYAVGLGLFAAASAVSAVAPKFGSARRCVSCSGRSSSTLSPRRAVVRSEDRQHEGSFAKRPQTARTRVVMTTRRQRL